MVEWLEHVQMDGGGPDKRPNDVDVSVAADHRSVLNAYTDREG